MMQVPSRAGLIGVKSAPSAAPNSDTDLVARYRQPIPGRWQCPSLYRAANCGAGFQPARVTLTAAKLVSSGLVALATLIGEQVLYLGLDRAPQGVQARRPHHQWAASEG